MSHLKKLCLVTGLGLVTACAPTSDVVYSQFHRPAGATLNTGAFGAANQSNIAIQSGQQSFALNLSKRFASEVNTTVNFAFNSAQLDDGAKTILRQQASWIRQFPEIRFRVYGHADAVGSNGYNKRLGLRRARAAVNYLVAQGISRSRLEAVTSLGESQPLIATQSRERRNRRTVTDVSGFMQGHPLIMDGKYAQIVYRDYVQSAEAESQLRTLDGGLIEELTQ